MPKIFRNTIVRNIALMSSATVAAQLINIIIQPILTRIVPAETLGIYTFLVSMANIAIPVASLKIDLLITSEKNEDFAQYITDSCIIITFIVSSLFLFIVGTGYIFDVSIFSQYGLLIFTVPVMVLTNGIRFLFISYNNRYRQYKIIGFIGILRELARGAIQVLSGLCNFGVIGQVIGYAIAPIFGFRTQAKDYIAKYHHRERINYTIFKKVIAVGRKQILFLVPSQFLNSFSSSLTIMFISLLYSSEQLGYYSAGVRLLEVPLIFIAANVSKVFYKQISEDVNQCHLVLSKFLKISLSLLCISSLAFGILFFIAPKFSSFVFGNGYEVAGEYIQCLCLMYAVRLVATSFTGLFTIFGKQQIELVLNLFFILSATIIYVVSKNIGLSMISFMWMISISYALIYMVLWIGYYRLCKSHDINLRDQKI